VIEPQATKDIKITFNRETLRKLGPAFVLASVTIGPGSVILSVMNGALFEYKMVWLLVLSGIFMAFYCEMFTRIAIVSKETVWQTIRRKYGVPLGILGGIMGFVTSICYHTGNITATGASLGTMFGGNIAVWSTSMTILAIIFILFKGLYKKIEYFVLGVILLMLLGFIGTLAITGFSVGGAAKGLVPTFPSTQAIFLGMAMMATFFSLNASIFQSYLVKEKKYQIKDLSNARLDAYSGVVTMAIILLVILFVAANVLHPQKIIPSSPADMAKQLEPLAGAFAHYLFGFGLFAAAFSSLIINSIAGGVFLADGLGKSASFDDKFVKMLSILVIVIAWVISMIPMLLNVNAVNAIVVAQAVSIIGLPYYGWVALKLGNDKEILGNFTNTKARNVMIGLGYLLSLAVAIYYAYSIFFS